MRSISVAFVNIVEKCQSILPHSFPKFFATIPKTRSAFRNRSTPRLFFFPSHSRPVSLTKNISNKEVPHNFLELLQRITNETNMTAASTSSNNVSCEKKRVSWNSSVKCLVIERCTSKTWYSDREYDSFRREIQTIQKLVCEDKLPSKLCCTRGIEHFIDSDIKSKKANNRFYAWDTVFAVQEQQWSAEEQDHQSMERSQEAIAKAYAQEVMNCQSEAFSRALQDQYEARAEYKNNSSSDSLSLKTFFKSKKGGTTDHHCHHRLGKIIALDSIDRPEQLIHQNVASRAA
jgi:hypothetical protein